VLARRGKFTLALRCLCLWLREGTCRRCRAPQARTTFFKLGARLAEQSPAAEQSA
jgi:hypothetical protein